MRINKDSHLSKLFDKLNKPNYNSWNDVKNLTIPAKSIKFKELTDDIYSQLGVIPGSKINNELASELLDDKELSNIPLIYSEGSEFTPLNTVELFARFSDGIFGDGFLYSDNLYIDTYWCYYTISDRSGKTTDYFIISTPKSYIRITNYYDKLTANKFLRNNIYTKVYLGRSTNELSMLPVTNDGEPCARRRKARVNINNNHVMLDNIEGFLLDDKPVIQLDPFSSFMIDVQEITPILINFIKTDIGVKKVYFSTKNFSERLSKCFSTY